MKANENNFIDLIKKQKEEGILYVIETYGRLLHSIVQKRLYAAPDRIEECMNDIFLGIWRNIHSFDETKGSFEGWAAGVARLEAIDTLRKLQRELQTVPFEDMEIPQEDPSFLKLAEQELSKETEEILGCLKPKDQELFRRIFLNEEEPEEAGEALGISRDNVYVRIFRGKQKIRSKFGERKRARV
ncbi:MAG: sigma-70 family RNA polymerase sigma factor [Lachnospiraceae bacterium]|nr:sigma-70 family RNA polymerase sigma factor [Lachnospiraceae bacterium]